MATRSPRRSGGRSCVPSESVDSQIGPSTRAGSARRAGRGAGSTTAAERGKGHDRVARPVERRPDQLGHAGVDDDLATTPVAHVEHARDQPAGTGHERPPGFDREAGRATVGRDRLERGRELAREALGGRGRLVGREDREPAAEVDACRTSRSSRATARPSRAPCGRRRARRRRHRAATRRAGGCRAGGADRRARHRPRSPRRSRSRSCRTWWRPDPTASPAWVSGATSGFSRYRTSRRSPAVPVRRTASASASASSGDSSAIQRSGEPVGGRTRGVTQVGGRLADALQRDPVVRHAGAAGQRPLAARDDVRAEPARGDLRDDRRHVVRLDRVLPDDRVRKRRRDGRRRRRRGSRGR